MLRTTSLALASLFLLTAAAFVLVPSSVDLTRMPLDPAVVEAQAAKVTLAQAIEKAEQATGSKAGSAQLSFEKGKASFDVLVYGQGTSKRVVVDGESGEIRETLPGAVLAGDPVTGPIVETASGLRYFDLRVGTGEQPASSAAKVKVHYAGWLLNGTKFDSSYDRNAPAEFPLNGVIAAWTEGVAGMKVGGKRKLIAPSHLAYGPAGRGPKIPPNAVLVFDVELLETK